MAVAAATCMQSWLLFACVHAWCLSSLGFMWIHGCVDSCRCMSSLAYVEPSRVLAMSTRRVRFMFMPTRFNIDIDHYRFLPMSKHVNVESNHCRLMSVLVNVESLRWPNTAHVDDGSSQCRQLLLSTLSTWSGAVNPVDSCNL